MVCAFCGCWAVSRGLQSQPGEHSLLCGPVNRRSRLCGGSSCWCPSLSSSGMYGSSLAVCSCSVGAAAGIGRAASRADCRWKHRATCVRKYIAILGLEDRGRARRWGCWCGSHRRSRQCHWAVLCKSHSGLAFGAACSIAPSRVSASPRWNSWAGGMGIGVGVALLGVWMGSIAA